MKNDKLLQLCSKFISEHIFLTSLVEYVIETVEGKIITSNYQGIDLTKLKAYIIAAHATYAKYFHKSRGICKLDLEEILKYYLSSARISNDRIDVLRDSHQNILNVRGQVFCHVDASREDNTPVHSPVIIHCEDGAAIHGKFGCIEVTEPGLNLNLRYWNNFKELIIATDYFCTMKKNELVDKYDKVILE